VSTWRKKRDIQPWTFLKPGQSITIGNTDKNEFGDRGGIAFLGPKAAEIEELRRENLIREFLLKLGRQGWHMVHLLETMKPPERRKACQKFYMLYKAHKANNKNWFKLKK
jgi:hypothetical protein